MKYKLEITEQEFNDLHSAISIAMNDEDVQSCTPCFFKSLQILDRFFWKQVKLKKEIKINKPKKKKLMKIISKKLK